MVVIDVDSHWEPPKLNRVGGHSSDRVRQIVETIAGEVLGQVPRDQWPPVDQLASPEMRKAFGGDVNPMAAALGSYDIDGRLQWCDAVGIDYQFVNAGGFTGRELAIREPQERRAALRMANDLLLDELDAHQQRFSAVTTVDLTDLDGAIKELERCRARGSRAFHVRTAPPGGVSYAHPDHDRLWSATVDLGMVPYVHIGNSPAHFDAGWANVGLDHPSSPGAPGLMRLSNTARTHTVEIMVSAMAYGGVFARHPKLTILVAELWVGWVPFLLRRIDQSTTANRDPNLDMMLGTWPYEQSAGNYVRQHVRVTPLPSQHSDAIATLRDAPEMIAFSSDYPHLEGSATPIDDLAPVIGGLDTATKQSFLGGSMLEVFERMGDPLPVRAGLPS
jgi:predicted TIM-barrel fold metal-dependent hydrolase